jgi:hypothetical protein
MKTMQNKTERGGRSTLRTPSNYGKHSRKPEQQAMPQLRRKPPSKNKLIALSAPGNPRETHADTYQASACSQTQPRLTSLNPIKVTELIQDLSDLRETLAPQVATSVAAGQRLFVTPEPLWEVSAEVREDGRVLLIRHPGLGWLGFILPQADCDRLAEKLTGELR